MDREAIAWITDQILAALERGDGIDPVALTFLLRCYAATDAPHLRDALEPALAHALDHHADAKDSDERARWLMLFAEALQLSADERLLAAASDLVARLRSRWGQPDEVSHAAAGLEACLVAAPFIDPQGIIPAAIDELERVVGTAYRVGSGLGRTGTDDSRLWLPDHVQTASALLTAYEITNRLPYSMLAEELVQGVRRTIWDEATGCFAEPKLDEEALFQMNCAASRVLHRLAQLHQRDEYRSSAVIASDAAYDEDAGRILAACSSRYQGYGTTPSAAYGLALMALGGVEDWRLKIED